MSVKRTHMKKKHTSIGKHFSKASGDVFTWKIISAVLAVIFVISILTNGFSVQSIGSSFGSFFDKMKMDSSDKDGEIKLVVDTPVKLDFYVMSQCPYGIQVEDGVKPVLDQLGPNVDFNLDFIGDVSDDGSFRSLHGQPEVDGDKVQLCAIKHNPNLYMELVSCMNKDTSKIPTNWEACAEKNNLDVESIKTCYEGTEGDELLIESFNKAKDAQASGSPTIYLNGAKYSGGRTEADFLAAICNSFEGTKPDACADVPEPVTFDLTIINDKICTSCTESVAYHTSLFQNIFPDVNVIVVDYEDSEAASLMEKYGVETLPAYIFDSKVTETIAWKNNQIRTDYFVETADSYVVIPAVVKATHNPLTSEICDNGVDDRDDDTDVDCDDSDCEGAMVCREEIMNNLQVFIMSDCPYGREAVKALKEVKDNFAELDFEIHYIASENADGTFNSLHGEYEVEENIRQLCVKEHNSDVWFDYVYCRSVNGVNGVDWKTCAQENSIDADVIETCVTGEEGKALHSEDIKIAQAIAVSASPTWLANNKNTFGGITPEQIKSEFCKYNEDLAGCGNTLSGEAGVPSGSC